jgi:hypothetical protein
LNTTLRNFAVSVGLGLVAIATPVSAQLPPAPSPLAGSAQASFYEVTENMRLIARGRARRVATSALVGTAQIGTAFCPTALVRAVSATAQICNLNANGEDDISLTTGLGSFDAKLSVVVQGDNPVDPPEFVIGKLRASGQMNFAPAVLNGLPYGTITGRVIRVGDDETPPARFVGVFRLPFLASAATRAALCPATPNPNPTMAQDLVYVDSGSTGTLNGICLNIVPNELSLGFPAVRFDIWFQ